MQSFRNKDGKYFHISYLYDDKMMITFNYKDGPETVSLSEIENADLSSDLTASALLEKPPSHRLGGFLTKSTLAGGRNRLRR